MHLSTFIEQVTNDPDSFGTKLKLKEAFDSIIKMEKIGECFALTWLIVTGSVTYTYAYNFSVCYIVVHA